MRVGLQGDGCLADALAQLRGGDLDQRKPQGQKEGGSSESWNQVEPGEEGWRSGQFLRFCLNNWAGRPSPPCLLRFPPTGGGAFSEQQKPHHGNTPYPPISKPTERSLAQIEDGSAGLSLRSSSAQQPRYPYLCTSLSLQGVEEETFSNIEVTREFSTPQSVSGLEGAPA